MVTRELGQQIQPRTNPLVFGKIPRNEILIRYSTLPIVFDCFHCMIGIDELSNFSSSVVYREAVLGVNGMAATHSSLPPPGRFQPFEMLWRSWLSDDNDLIAKSLFLLRVDQHNNALLGAPATAPAAVKCSNGSGRDLLGIFLDVRLA
jgi:hypothetical protein